MAVLSPSAAETEPVRLEIDKDSSRIAADVKATGHRFEAVVTDYEIHVAWDPANEQVTAARLEFDFADVKTGRDRRDREMLEWLDHETYPTAVFELESMEADGDGLTARGTFTFHGVEREIEFPAAIRRAEGTFRITADIELDHREWGLDIIRAMLFMTVDPVLSIEIDLYAELP